ncbi:Hint domain-containing protein [Nioella nitratireducens]|uniref:Hint domain-containing protein n=1 Tax=Nioella nitratireducens TaxID=1287720 RepID=UPI0011BAC743|nr:Hint domain-containing protein [Nioella nitratireducens]
MTKQFLHQDIVTPIGAGAVAMSGLGGASLPLGLQGHTQVRTPYGDVPASDLTAGALVETFEDGVKEIRAVIQRRAWTNRAERCLEHWPFEIPPGVLGNLDVLHLMQHQAVIFECDLVEKMTGDPFVLLPVKALDGYRGIKPVEPAAESLVYELAFDQPQAICTGSGTYVLAHDALSLEVACGRRSIVDNCKALSWEKARRLMIHLETIDRADRACAAPTGRKGGAPTVVASAPKRPQAAVLASGPKRP